MAMTVNVCTDFAKWSMKLAERVEMGDGGCWLWTGPVDRKGYGKFIIRLNGRRVQTGAPERLGWSIAMTSPKA